MQVAAAGGVADAEELEGAIGVVDAGLGLAVHQRFDINFAGVGGLGFERKIEVVVGSGGVVDDDLVDGAFA